MRRSVVNKRRRIRYGQAILLGVVIERDDDQAYAKPRWYARLPGNEPVSGPWIAQHQAVSAALGRLGVLGFQLENEEDYRGGNA